MIAKSAIYENVVKIFRNKLGVVVPDTEADLFETGMMDSLKFVELVFNLEKVFGSKILVGTLELDQFRTIANIVKFVEESMEINGIYTT